MLHNNVIPYFGVYWLMFMFCIFQLLEILVLPEEILIFRIHHAIVLENILQMDLSQSVCSLNV